MELYQLPAYTPTSPAGSLRQAIFDSNAAGGNNVTLDAINAGRAIFVQAGTVSVSNLTINNAVAQGGAGGNGAGVAGNLNSGGGVGGGTDNHAINVGLRFSW